MIDSSKYLKEAIFFLSNPAHLMIGMYGIYPWHQFFWLVIPPLVRTFILMHLLL